MVMMMVMVMMVVVVMIMMINIFPRLITSQKETMVTSSLKPRVGVRCRGDSMYTIVFTLSRLAARMFRNLGKSSWLVMISSAPVSFNPCTWGSLVKCYQGIKKCQQAEIQSMECIITMVI